MFKKGDRVRCVNSGGNINLVVGHEYTVERSHEEFTYVEDAVGFGGGYYTYRFELVNDRQAVGDAIALLCKYKVGMNPCTRAPYYWVGSGPTTSCITGILDKLFPPVNTAKEEAQHVIEDLTKQLEEATLRLNNLN